MQLYLKSPFFGILLLLTACNSESSEKNYSTIKGEYIYRQHDEQLFSIEKPKIVDRGLYPWENGVGKHAKITKEFFRCKGSTLNPPRIMQKDKEILRFYDCGGSQKHSLPLKDDKEYIYPILIDLLNYLQTKTEKKVVITSGHSCPDHNSFLDSSVKNQSTKHLLGAEVDFYIQGMENQPNKVVDLIQGYYKEKSKYKGLKDYEEFQRYEKGDSNTVTKPWYNKEVFIKLYKKDEGRDGDNRHSFPYISIQVRYDWDAKEKVTYSWEKAFHFHRW